MTVCISCLDEMCFICEAPNEEGEACCCKGTYGRVSMAGLVLPTQLTETTGNPVGRPRMNGEDMKSPLTAGRARAEDIAPLSEDMICEWAMLLNAGGGISPIVGCEGNVATARHHGPDKSTLNNNPGVNLHRICAKCHNRWHYRNDAYYGKRPVDNSDYLPLTEHGECHPHDRITQATPLDVQSSNIYWGQPVQGRKPYRHWEKQDEQATASR